MLRALGVATDGIPTDLAERSALWRAELADRKVLLVLDNASTSQQVRPLLPGSPTCLALITSRRRLADLDTAETLSLDVLPEADALTLFTSVVGADRVAAELQATMDVLRLCGYLPLAIRIAAARLRTRPSWPVRALAERLGDELAIGDRSVTAALALSYHRLDERRQHLFALLGQHPGVSFDRYQAAALGDIDVAEVGQALDELVDVHLLQEPTPGRYRFHDLVRQYARTKTTVAEPIRHAAVGRLLDHYRYLAHTVDTHLNPVTPEVQPAPPRPVPPVIDTDAAVEWCETELANLTAVINHAATHGWRTHAWQTASALYWFFKLRGYTTEWISCLHLGLDATENDNDRANLLRQLGHAHYAGGDHPKSLTLLHEALALFHQTGDRWGEGATLGNIGAISFYAGRFTEAIEYYEQDLAVRETTGNLSGIGLTLANISYAYEELGRMKECLDYAQRALDFFRRTGDRRGEGVVLGTVAWAYLRVAHDPATALSYAQQALAIDREVRDRR
ncbi:MAG TPA: tetratricopeptide repeat protein, partial [Pseudonocardiaceae bacterium]